MRKLSKSDFNEATDIILSDESMLNVLVSERDYWKLRYELLLKYKELK